MFSGKELDLFEEPKVYECFNNEFIRDRTMFDRVQDDVHSVAFNEVS